ncbi:hypothetical protein OROHE_017552 [Orobanche hederae]
MLDFAYSDEITFNVINLIRAFNYALKNGIALEEDYPYRGPKQSPSGGPKYFISDYKYLDYEFKSRDDPYNFELVCEAIVRIPLVGTIKNTFAYENHTGMGDHKYRKTSKSMLVKRKELAPQRKKKKLEETSSTTPENISQPKNVSDGLTPENISPPKTVEQLEEELNLVMLIGYVTDPFEGNYFDIQNSKGRKFGTGERRRICPELVFDICEPIGPFRNSSNYRAYRCQTPTPDISSHVPQFQTRVLSNFEYRNSFLQMDQCRIQSILQNASPLQVVQLFLAGKIFSGEGPSDTFFGWDRFSGVVEEASSGFFFLSFGSNLLSLHQHNFRCLP